MSSVLVSGSREWADGAYVFEALDLVGQHVQALQSRSGDRVVGITKIIEGCAPGADDWAARWAVTRGGAEVAHHPAHWRHSESAWTSLGIHPVPACPPDCRRVRGRAAGVLRNGEMLALRPLMVVAFHADLEASKGTADMVRRAKAAGAKLVLFTGSALPEGIE